jgi:hypothetical protein
MIIGIDASRAFVRDKTGTETYSYHLIKAMLRLPKSRQHTFVLFIRPKAILPKYLNVYTNVIVKGEMEIFGHRSVWLPRPEKADTRSVGALHSGSVGGWRCCGSRRIHYRFCVGLDYEPW